MGKPKHSYEYVYNCFRDKGCELLEDEYVNNKTKMKYKCSCNNISQVTFDKFRTSSKCIKCSGVEKHSQEYITEKYKDHGYILNSIYNGNKNKDDLICPEGHKIKMKFNAFQRNHRCKECYRIKCAVERHPNYNNDRTRSRRSNYLRFDLRKINILKEESLYDHYIQSKEEAKLSNNRWNKSNYTVDHIHPRIAFVDNNLDVLYGDKLVKKICNLRENLRIILKEENTSKGGKYNQEEFMAWFNEKIKIYIGES